MTDEFDNLGAIAARYGAELRNGSSILLLGLSGSGKTTIAERIHERAARGGDLVVINGRIINSATAESKLFGHVRGAFTGAVGSMTGLVEQANGGTLFIDELSELSVDVQGYLLQVMDHGGVYRRFGCSKERRSNFRVIAATTSDPEQMIAEGRLLRDLYNRLCDEVVIIPRIETRPDDIAAIARQRFDELASEFSQRRLTLAKQAIQELQGRAYPRQARDVRRDINRACTRAVAEFGETGEGLVDVRHFTDATPSIDSQILAHLSRAPKGLKRGELIQALSAPTSAARKGLDRLRARGLVVSRDGRWRSA